MTHPSAHRRRDRLLRRLPSVGRLFLGLVFFVFGLNGFLNFIPPPPDPGPPEALALGRALFESGYLFELIKGTEVITGLLLLADFLVPLALVVLAPVILNIFLFHVILAAEGLLLAALLVIVEALLALHYRAVYAPLFRRPRQSERQLDDPHPREARYATEGVR